jgi:hemerythrin-like domain-containing protein
MQIKTLDGNTQNWQLTGHFSHAKIENKSSLHIEARALLKNMYPTLQILEEIPVPVKKGDTYYFDFYVPMIKKVIEVHGEQHYKFIPFYHSNKLSYLKSQKRDREKKEWCEVNGIKYIELAYNLKDEWEQIIANN